MTTQLTLTGEEAKVCTRCGTPRIIEYGIYNGDHCRTCRADDEETKDCSSCDTPTLELDLYAEHIYMTPWDEEEEPTGFVYCQSCIDQGRDREEHFYCDGCSRDIMESRGMVTFYRILNDCEQICLKCIQDELEEGGVAGVQDDGDTLRNFFRGKLFGMFFNVGELEEKGWRAVPFFGDRMIADRDDARTIGRIAERLHKRGHAFILGYERLSTLGDEGWVTLYWNPAVTVEIDEVAA